MIRKLLFENVCRLCGQEKRNGVNVLNGQRGNELLLKINNRLSKEIIRFYPEDGLPKFVCSDCEVVVNSFSEFCNMVHSVQQKLEAISNGCGENPQCLEERSLGYAGSISVSAGGCLTCLLCDTRLGNNPGCATLHLVGHGIASPRFICQICGSTGGIESLLSDSSWNKCRACNSQLGETQRRDNPQGIESELQVSNDGEMRDETQGPIQQLTREGDNQKKKKKSQSKSGSVEKNFTCEVCTRSFASRAHLSRHRLVHSGARPFRCEFCPAAFSQRGSLQVHSLQHSGTAPYMCPYCPRSFRFKVSLRSHILNNHGESSGRETQGFGERSSSNVAPVIRTEIQAHGHKTTNGEKPSSSASRKGIRPSSNYCCDRCGKEFATAYKLGRHYRSHTGERPFECRDCGRRFSQTCNLNLHRKTHHSVHQSREEGDSTEDNTADNGRRETVSDTTDVTYEEDVNNQVVSMQSFAEMENELDFSTMAMEKGAVSGRQVTSECILGDFEEGIAQSLLEESSEVVRHHGELSLMPSPLSCTTPTISAMDKVLSGQALSQIMEGDGLAEKVFSKLATEGEANVMYHSGGLIAEEGFPGIGTLGERQFGEYLSGNEEGNGLLFLVEEEGLSTHAFPSLQTPPPISHS